MMSPQEKTLLEKLGKELASNSARLEQLGAQLCSNSELAAQFIDVLQDIDLLAQRQNMVAKILTSDDMLASSRDMQMEHFAYLQDQ